MPDVEARRPRSSRLVFRPEDVLAAYSATQHGSEMTADAKYIARAIIEQATADEFYARESLASRIAARRRFRTRGSKGFRRAHVSETSFYSDEVWSRSTDGSTDEVCTPTGMSAPSPWNEFEA